MPHSARQCGPLRTLTSHSQPNIGFVCRTEWFNTSAFAVAAPWSLGNAPRYFSDLRAPGYKNFDIGIQKSFPIEERYRFQSAWICSTPSTIPTTTALTRSWALDLGPSLQHGHRGKCRQR